MKNVFIFIIFAMAFCGGHILADEYRIISFDYPPYTYDDGRDGLAVVNIKKAFARAGHQVRMEYYPVARAFQKFKNDKMSLFAGNISQFEQSDDLGCVVNLSMTEKILTRTDFKNDDTKVKLLAVLRGSHININIDFIDKIKMQPFYIDSNDQATDLIIAGRVDFLTCLSEECEALIVHSKNKLRVLEGSETAFDLHLVFHRDSAAGKQALLLRDRGFFGMP